MYEAPIGPHLFGLPFSVHEFLVICGECEKYYTGDNKAAVPKYKGSDHLFFRMVADLAIERINTKDFLADQIPANLEKSTGLLRVLASAQGKHTQNFEIDYMRFIQSITANDEPWSVQCRISKQLRLCSNSNPYSHRLNFWSG
jgi:hypothetical protein